MLKTAKRVNLFDAFGQRRGMSLEEQVTHLAKLLPRGGLVELTGGYEHIDPSREIIVTIYNPISNSYEEADFDTTMGQPIPNGTFVGMALYKPISTLDCITFKGYNQGGPLEFAGFVDAWLEFLHNNGQPFARGADLIEVGKIIGDTHNRYIPLKLYKKA